MDNNTIDLVAELHLLNELANLNVLSYGFYSVNLNAGYVRLQGEYNAAKVAQLKDMLPIQSTIIDSNGHVILKAQHPDFNGFNIKVVLT